MRLADEEAIRKLAKEWSLGWERGDAPALLALYADDPILLPQGRPPVMGKAAIGSLYQSLFKEYSIKGEGGAVEAEASGDLGYFWSAYKLTATPKTGGAPIRSEGKSLFIVRRQNDNSWKITRLIDNSNQE